MAAEGSALERFQLFNECERIGSLAYIDAGGALEDLTDHAGPLEGLTGQSVRQLVDDRLRAAQLLGTSDLSTIHAPAETAPDATPDAAPTGESPEAHLMVNIHVTGPSFRVGVGFHKWVLDQRSGQTGFGLTWEAVHMGVHGGESAPVLAAVAEKTDVFVEDYRRVNEPACNAGS